MKIAGPVSPGANSKSIAFPSSVAVPAPSAGCVTPVSVAPGPNVSLASGRIVPVPTLAKFAKSSTASATGVTVMGTAVVAVTPSARASIVTEAAPW